MNTTGIKPFYLHVQAEDQVHLCPIRALAEWVQVSGINKGYLFRRIWSGDRVADLDKNTPMVSLHKPLNPSLHTEHDCRHQSSSWNCSGTISLTSILTTIHTEPTLSDGVDVSILLPTADGHSEGSVTGEVGAWSSPI
jgi:hypothetical protein